MRKRRFDFDVPLNWFGDPDPAGGAGGDGSDGGGGEDGGDGAGGKGVTVACASQMSPELRADKELMKLLEEAPKINDLATRYRDLHGRSKRSIVIPNAEKPDPAEVKALREALDIPEKEDGYALKIDAFKDLQSAQPTAQAVTKHAAASSLTRVQAQKTLDFILGIQRQARAAAEKAGKEYRGSFETRLLEAVQGDTKKRDAIINLATRFWVKRIGDAALIKSADARGDIHDTALALKLAKVEADMSEEPFFDGEAAPPRKGAKQGRMGSYDPEFENRYGGKGT